jgi:hypothetical protein
MRMIMIAPCILACVAGTYETFLGVLSKKAPQNDLPFGLHGLGASSFPQQPLGREGFSPSPCLLFFVYVYEMNFF